MLTTALVLASSAGHRAHNLGHLLLILGVVALVLAMGIVGLFVLVGGGAAIARVLQTNRAVPWLVFVAGLAVLALGYIAASGSLMFLGGLIAVGMFLYALARLDG